MAIFISLLYTYAEKLFQFQLRLLERNRSLSEFFRHNEEYIHNNMAKWIKYFRKYLLLTGFLMLFPLLFILSALIW